MINTPEENIKLTDEQTKQIEEANLRLASIQNEVGVSTKLLNSLRNDCIRIGKEKDYQDSVLEETKKQVVTAQAKSDELNAENIRAIKALTEVNKMIDGNSLAQTTKDNEIKTREYIVEKDEQRIKEQEQRLDIRGIEFGNEKADFDEKVLKLKEVIKQL